MAKKKATVIQEIAPTFESIQELKQWTRLHPGTLSPAQISDEKRKINEKKGER